MNGWDQWDDPVIALTLFVQRFQRAMTTAPYDAERAKNGHKRHLIVGAYNPRPVKACRWCGTGQFEKGRRSYCSEACKQETVTRMVPGYARTIVGRRDKWTCELCGGRGYDCDHRVPVSEGGGCCGVDNLRILCGQCHGAETGKLRKRLNAQTRDREEVERGQTTFRLDPIAGDRPCR
jgi:hypothetical protein